jgi:hypothetical protein
MESNNINQDFPLVSILMVNYNGQAHVKEFFESVYALEYPKDKFEVVVVDNASKDDSQDWIEKNYPQVKLVRLDENTGFAKGNNIGVKHCQGKFVALINNDTVLDKNWLMELVKPALKEPNAIYSSKMLCYDHHDYISYGEANLYPWGEGCCFQMYKKDTYNSSQPFLIMYACGCGVLFSKETFLNLGGFDESYFCYAEDFELCWKAWLMGYHIYSVPNARFYHKGNATLGVHSPTVIYLCCRNQMRNIIKFTGTFHLIFMLPLFMVWSFALCFVFYPRGDKNYALVIPTINAGLSIIKEFPYLLRVRRKIQQERKVKDKELEKLGIILSWRQGIKARLADRARTNNFQKQFETK